MIIRLTRSDSKRGIFSMIEYHEAAFADWAGLPFVKAARVSESDEVQVNFWSVPTSGDYGTDCATGRRYAAELVTRIRETGNTLLLSRVRSAMPQDFTGVEIGFEAGLASALMRT